MNIAIPVSSSKTQFYINQMYINYIANAGLQPVIVTPYNNAIDIAKQCDGLILPGGTDVDPIFYGNDNYQSLGVDPEKDNFERSLLLAFVKEGKKVFGICRGAQLIMLEFLRLNKKYSIDENRKEKYSFLIDYVQHVSGHDQKNLNGERSVRTHFVTLIPKHLYGDGPEEPVREAVNSMHHQCITVVAPKGFKEGQVLFKIGMLEVIAVSKIGFSKEKEYVVEAFSLDWGGGILAVQWHPEELNDIRLINNFFTPQAIQAIK